jgi:hypothetical protein
MGIIGNWQKVGFGAHALTVFRPPLLAIGCKVGQGSCSSLYTGGRELLFLYKFFPYFYEYMSIFIYLYNIALITPIYTQTLTRAIASQL